MGDDNLQRRIEDIHQQANAEPDVPDLLMQKIVQELGEMAQREAVIAGQVASLKAAQEQHRTKIDALADSQQKITQRLEQPRPRPDTTPSQRQLTEADVDQRIKEKLLIFKVKVGCALAVIGLIVAAAVLFWPDDSHDEAHSEPQKGAMTHAL